MPRRRKLLLRAAVTLLLISSLATVGIWLHARSLDAQFAKVQKGMAREQVIALLGSPTESTVAESSSLKLDVWLPEGGSLLTGYDVRTNTLIPAYSRGTDRLHYYVGYDQLGKVVMAHSAGRRLTLWERIKDWWSGPQGQTFSF